MPSAGAFGLLPASVIAGLLWEAVRQHQNI